MTAGIRILTVSIVHPDGRQDEVAPNWSMVKEAMGNAVLEPVWLNDGACFLVDEDTAWQNNYKEFNQLASNIAGRKIFGKAAFIRRHLIIKVLG